MATETSERSGDIALQSLETYVGEFGVTLPAGAVSFVGSIPPPEQTRSETLNLSLIGTIPSAANAAIAAQIFEARGGSPQTVEADLRRGHNYIDPDIGMTPSLNGQEITRDLLAGNPFTTNIFETRDNNFVILSAVYVDLAYQWTAFLGSSMAHSDVRSKVKKWNASDLEAAAEEAGLPMAICRTEEAWATHPQGAVMARLPWVPVERLSHHFTDDSAKNGDRSLPYPSVQWCRQQPTPPRPLSGLRVLCVTHAIAGPSTGRTLAEHGASVLQVMFTHGFEHSFVYTYANLGTASTRLNLHKPSDCKRLQTLVQNAHVWVDSYRPEAISKFGFGDEELQRLNRGLIICRVRCYGTSGPWANKPGFDMQGSASSGMMWLMDKGDGTPRWPPGMVINDYTTGYSAALAIQSILLKRLRGDIDAHDGWLVSPSLTGTAMGIMRHFKTDDRGLDGRDDARGVTSQSFVALPPETLESQTTLGYLKTLAPLPKMSLTPIRYDEELLVPIGSSRPVFPSFDDGYSFDDLNPLSTNEVMGNIGVRAARHLESLASLGNTWRSKLGI